MAPRDPRGLGGTRHIAVVLLEHVLQITRLEVLGEISQRKLTSDGVAKLANVTRPRRRLPCLEQPAGYFVRVATEVHAEQGRQQLHVPYPLSKRGQLDASDGEAMKQIIAEAP